MGSRCLLRGLLLRAGGSDWTRFLAWGPFVCKILLALVDVNCQIISLEEMTQAGFRLELSVSGNAF